MFDAFERFGHVQKCLRIRVSYIYAYVHEYGVCVCVCNTYASFKCFTRTVSASTNN